MNRRLLGIMLSMMMLVLFSSGRAWADVAVSAQPVMVKDINATKIGASSNANGFVSVGGVTFFSATDGVRGQELWKSDGTEAGTAMVKDINPAGSSSPTSLTAVGTVLYFTADDGTNGIELWKSDGTTAGTVLVKDITSAGSSSLGNLTDVGGVLYFTAGDYTNGYSLWKSDGTDGGTVVVKAAIPVVDGVYAYISGLTNVGGVLYFTVGHQLTGYALWKSDATGTVMVKDFGPGSQVTSLTSVGGILSFSAYDMTNGWVLWKSDGTTVGTVPVKNCGLYTPPYLTNVNGVLYFTAHVDGVSGTELWRVDATAGAVLVKDICSGACSSSPQNLTNVNGILYFVANDGTTSALWRSDATDGAVLVKSSGDFRNMVSVGAGVNGALYFTSDGTNGMQLWKSDATAGVALVSDFGSESAYGARLSNLTNVNGVLYFNAYNIDGTQPWKSDGTADGTVMLKQIFTGTGPSLGLMKENPVVNVNGVLYFTAYSDLVDGLGLWKSDGTDAGTVLVKSFGLENTTLLYLTNVNGVLYFANDNYNNGATLWKSDGTTAGTVQVGTVSSPENLTNVNGVLYFIAYNNGGSTLWKSDGTDAGTVQVAGVTSPANLTDVNGVLYFTQISGTYPTSCTNLWKSDANGTVYVKEIYCGTSSYPLNMKAVGGVLYFTATDATNGTALWKSDVNEGAILVKVVNPVGSPISAYYLNSSANVNGVLYFAAFDPQSGFALWKSDAALGPVLVKNNFSFSFSGMSNVNGVLYFIVNNTSGTELWRSNGTEEGTVLVKSVIFSGDIIDSKMSTKTVAKTVAATVGPVPRGGSSTSLVEANGVLYFTAYDAAHGTELWSSDGTVAGTAMVADINPGADSAYPYNLVNVNGTLFFAANDGFHGTELWVLKATQAIGEISFSLGVLAVNGTATVTATATSGLGVTFTSATPSVCAVSGSSLTGLAAGICTIAANQTGNGNFTAATQVMRDINVGIPTGDITGDGGVDVADALKALRIAVGLDAATADSYIKADVAPLKDGKPAPDGVIDIGDVVVLLQKAVGLRNW